MRSYQRINQSERNVIQKMIYSGKNKSEIATMLGRKKSTICREIKRNKTHGYIAAEADIISKSRFHGRKSIIQNNHILNAVIENYMRDGNSPDVISGYYLKHYFKDNMELQISHECIYQWIYKHEADLQKYLFTRRKKRQNRSNIYKSRGKDSSKKNISQRPAAANNKIEHGHLEGDTIVSSGKDAYLLTLIDRKNSHLWAIKTPVKDAELMGRAIVEALQDLPKGYLKTITLDNGTEFANHKQFEEALGCSVYFADPYSAYQRGLNEHINGRIRYYC